MELIFLPKKLSGCIEFLVKEVKLTNIPKTDMVISVECQNPQLFSGEISTNVIQLAAKMFKIIWAGYIL